MESNELLLKTLANTGITALNKVQEAAIQTIQNHPDTLLLAPTGSGKTLAFLIPVLQQLDANKPGVQCLILSPTRELAIQIEKVWQKMGTGFKVNTCYGGHAIQTEINNLSQPPTVLIGTPGRVLDHITRKSVDVSGITTLILDEFDKSLTMGFQDQMADIVKELHNLEKKVLVSATNKLLIPEFLRFSAEPQVLDFTTDDEKTTDGLSLKLVISPEKDKIDTLFELLCHIGAESTLIFCNNRESAERVNELLGVRGVHNAYFHGGMDQLEREKTLVRFRNGSVLFLVASDLAARGLDIPDVKNVIHYHLPFKKPDFIHRNGRTARMNAEGVAYILLHTSESLPEFIPDRPPVLELPEAGQNRPPEPEWVTVYVSGGKKDKLSKGDIVGFFCQKGELAKADLGLIEVLDHLSFVAVRADAVHVLLAKIQNERMKGKKYKIGINR